jgi:hypothetical protein
MSDAPDGPRCRMIPDIQILGGPIFHGNLDVF